jgi:hypothetical protein
MSPQIPLTSPFEFVDDSYQSEPDLDFFPVRAKAQMVVAF